MIPRDLHSYSKLLSQYTELRIQDNRTLQIGFLKGNLIRNIKNSSSGASARVWHNGSWGFASAPEISSSSIEAVIKAAAHNALFLDSKANKGRSPLAQDNPVLEKDFSTQKNRLNQNQLIQFMKEIDNYIEKTYPKVSTRTLSLNCLDMEKTLLNSDGASLYSFIPRTTMSLGLTIEKYGQPVEVFDVLGGLGQFEDVFFAPSDLYEKIDTLYNHLINKSEGVYPEAGLKECILSSNITGILAHEAIGHTTEADLVLGGSVAANYIDKRVANPIVSIVDYAHSYNGASCPVPIYIDDEGTKAEDVVIIENGILKSFMHNKESAEHFNVKPTGNGRAFQFFDEPIIRMRNTAILPGKDKLENMISSIEDGYYLLNTNNGQADTTSEFMFGVTMGYEIKNGRLGRAIRDTTISGVAFDVLKTTTMLSDNMTWLSGGMCGKKQLITVGIGGPDMKCKLNIGGI